VLEELVALALRRRRVEGFAAQYVIRDASGRVVARADFADPVCMLVVEVDGWAYHGSRSQQQQDKRRDRRLAGLGWQTLRFTTEDVVGRIDSVVAEIIDVRAARSTAA
jgi:very-short-patch-repair endonuclease